MTEKNPARRSAVRDEGAPQGDPPASHTVPDPDPALTDVQAGVVRGATVASTLPVGPDQVTTTAPDALTATGTVPVPASAPSTAPAGSMWGDATADQQPSQVNESTPGPRVGYVITWAKAAVHVDPSQARTRPVDGDDGKEERYLTVTGAAGIERDVVLDGQQITLERGDVLPDAAAPGQGQFLTTIGGAVAVSIPVAPPPA